MSQNKYHKLSITELRSALIEAGWSCETTEVDGKRHEIFKKGITTWETPRALLRYPFVTDSMRSLTSNKTLSSEYVKRLGGNIPHSIEMTRDDNLDEAAALLGQYQCVIVKPHNGSDSRGLSLNVTNLDELMVALECAWEYSGIALVQQMVAGKEYRFTVLNKKIISILERQPAQLVGDGEKTIAELLVDENNFRLTMADSAMQYQLLVLPTDQDPLAVLKRGEIASLNQSVSMSEGASVYERLAETHSSYRELIEDIAVQLNVDFVAIDLLLTDITVPMNADNWYFLEFNTGPALQYYSSTRNNKVTPVIALLVEKIEELVL